MESLQSFGCILRGDATPIFLLRGLRAFWRETPSFWFSHAPIDTWEITWTRVVNGDKCRHLQSLVPQPDLKYDTLHGSPTALAVGDSDNLSSFSSLTWTTYTDTLDTNMHLLLHYDQIYRHPCPRIPNTSKPIAFRFAVALALHMIHVGQYAAAEPWERVFILLALRHAEAVGLKELALRKCIQEAEADPSPLWCRFLNATVWSIHSWREATEGYAAEPVADLDSLHTFSALLEPPRSHAVDTTVIRPAIERCIGNLPRVAVSVSGGVDSMVAATVAAALCKKRGTQLVLLHISYRNRPECEDECNLLRWWSQQLGVPLYIRRITEIQRVRNSVLRTVYEDVTRRIRFAFYRHFGCPVILGHNLDDCYENVFSNLSKRIHMENLFGMTATGQEQGVTVLRPLLDIPKSVLIAYADKQGIPHLYDSTPAWSRRGQMRDRLIPGIREFDVGILEGLREMVARSRFLEAQWEQSFRRWCGELRRDVGCDGSDGGVELPKDAFLLSNWQELHFWVRIFQFLGWPRPSNKSLRNCMDMLQRRTEGKCNLGSNMQLRIGTTTLVLCWKK